MRHRRLLLNRKGAAVIWPLVAVEPRPAAKQTKVKTWGDRNTMLPHIQLVADEHGDRQQETPDARSYGYASAIHVVRANVPAHRRRANDIRLPTEAQSRRSVQPMVRRSYARPLRLPVIVPLVKI